MPEVLASLMIQSASESDSQTVDAVGPESFTYRELIQHIGSVIGNSKSILSVPPSVGYLISKVINKAVQDIVITREEISGLMRGLLDSDQPSTGTTSLSEYIQQNKDALGHRYANEIKRRTDRRSSYEHI